MNEIRLKDRAFSHAYCASNGDLEVYPKNFRWYRGNDYRDITVYTDNEIFNVDNDPIESKYKIAWLIEPEAINSRTYKWIQSYYEEFDLVLTHNKDMLGIQECFKWIPFGGTWIKPDNRFVSSKEKFLSIIASGKRQTEGHKLRHDVIDRFRDDFDLICGKGYDPIDDKIHSLKEYKYQVVIENEKCDNFFTEKIMDCFMTGTVPVYWGSPTIGDIFDTNGIITFNSLDELGEIIYDISSTNDYQNRMSSIMENFIIAQKYAVVEDYLWENLFKEML